jgi:hypothetical protein
MGKTAENERLKLRATFYNNVAAGLLIGGLLIPFLAVAIKAEDITERLVNWNLITASDLRVVIAYAFAMSLALSGAKSLRRHADSIIAGIKDDE